MLDHLGDRAEAGRDHRRPAGHRLDHDEPERLLPLDREQRRPRVLQQLHLLAVGDLAEVLDLVVEVGLDELVEVAVLLQILLLARQLERQPGLLRHPDRAVRALVCAHAAEEQQVVAAVGLARVEL